MKDIEDAWSDVQRQVYHERSSLEDFVARQRYREGVEIQEFQLEQASKKREDSMKIFDEFNEINDELEKIRKEEAQKAIEIQREELRKKKMVHVELRVSEKSRMLETSLLRIVIDLNTSTGSN